MPPNAFTLPDVDTARSGYSVELPPGLAAEIERVRIVANALLPHPLALERAMLRSAPADLRAYTDRLYPLASIGHALEGEILAAFARGADALERLAVRRSAAWALFLDQYADFVRSTRKLRSALGIQLDPPELLEPLARSLRGERVPPEDLPGVERGPSDAPREPRSGETLRGIEAAIDALDAEKLLAVARDAQPLAPERVPDVDPIRFAWDAILAWRERVPRERVRPNASPAPAPEPTTAPRTADDIADALRAAERARVAQALQRNATFFGRWSKRPLEQALRPYLATITERQAGLPPDARDTALLSECAALLEETRSVSRDARPLERALHRVRTAWRGTPLPVRIGLGAACAAASLFGGPAAPFGIAGAIALRAAASVAAADGGWETAERLCVRRALNRPRGLRDLGRSAWVLQWNARGSNDAAKRDAGRLMEQVRTQLRTSADLGTIVRGLSAGARMRPLHAAGKLAASAAMLFGASFAEAGEAVSDARASLGAVVPTQVLPPPAAVDAAASAPSAIALRVSASGDANCLEKLIRPHVLRSMEEQGVPLDPLDVPMQARALNATANVVHAMPRDALHPGDVVSLDRGLLARAVGRSLDRPAPEGAASWVGRVGWPKWTARAKELA